MRFTFSDVYFDSFRGDLICRTKLIIFFSLCGQELCQELDFSKSCDELNFGINLNDITNKARYIFCLLNSKANSDRFIYRSTNIKRII